MNLLFIGISGSGKDTQAEMLKNKFGFKIVSTGEMFRSMKDTEDAKLAMDYVNKGSWVPDELTFKMLGEYMKQYNAGDNFIFTGVVRTQPQIQLLDSMLAASGKNLDHVVFFDLSEEAAVERLSKRWVCPIDKSIYHEIYSQEKVKGKCDICGGDLVQRADDKPESIKARFAEFNKNNGDILKEYTNKNILIKLDASKSIDDVNKELIEMLKLG